MRPSERRNKIMERLSFRRHDTMQNLADEFGVSWDTIHRDILCLEAEYPIVVTPGRGGGVRLPDGYYTSQKHITPKQIAAIQRVLSSVCSDDRETLESILSDFA